MSPLLLRSRSMISTAPSSSLMLGRGSVEQAAASAAPAAPASGATGLAAAVDSALAVVPLSADRRGGAFGSALDGGLCACYG